MREAGLLPPASTTRCALFFLLISLQPLKKRSTTNYAPFALVKGPGSLADRPGMLLLLGGLEGNSDRNSARNSTSSSPADNVCTRNVEGTRKVDRRLPGKGNSNPDGARPVRPIITMVKWIRASRLPIKNSICCLHPLLQPGVISTNFMMCLL